MSKARKFLVVIAVLAALTISSQPARAGYRSGDNKGYIYVRSGRDTVQAKDRLVQKEKDRKARKVRKERAPRTQWIKVHFEKGKADIVSPYNHRLNRAARLLKINGQKEVRIIGSADRTGSAEANKALGLRRAKAVRDYLVGEGVEGKRIKVDSRGSSKASKGSDEKAMYRDRNAKFQIVLAGRKK